MKNKINSFFIAAGILSIFTVAFFSCKKDIIVTADKQVALFVSTSTGAYAISGPGQTYKVYVGLTKASKEDRTVAISITSPTGAVQGTHYTVSSNSLTFTAGSVLDSITVTADYPMYNSGRIDTLNFAFTNPDDGLASLNNSFTLKVTGVCLEGNLVANRFLGSWPQTNELFGTSAYGPYEVTISAVTPLTATTGRITVTNIWDYGWNPIDFILDWTDPANRTVTVVAATSGIADAGTLNPTYAGQEVAVRPFAGESGTFSFCSGTIILKMQLGVTGVGYFTSLYTVTPGR